MAHFPITFLTYFICICHQNNHINRQTFQSIFQSPRDRFCKFKSFASPHRSKINSIQNQRKIIGGYFNTFHVTGHDWELGCSRPHSFIPHGIAIPVSVQSLQAVVLFPMKYKPTSRQGVASQVTLHQNCQTVKTLPHVCWFNA